MTLDGFWYSDAIVRLFDINFHFKQYSFKAKIKPFSQNEKKQKTFQIERK